MKTADRYLRIWSHKRGQDLIEYALMAGFLAVGATAILPGVSAGVSTIFSEIGSAMVEAATPGGSAPASQAS